MEFLKRPVAPYFVPVPGLDDLPPRGSSRSCRSRSRRWSAGARRWRPPLAVERHPRRGPAPLTPASSRSSDSTAPTVGEAAPLSDRRRPAGARPPPSSALTEATPDGSAPRWSPRSATRTRAVRRAAAEGLRELVEVLPSADGLATTWAPATRSSGPPWSTSCARCTPGRPRSYRAALADVDHRVRIEAVRALVSLDDWETVATAIAQDENREVRIAVRPRPRDHRPRRSRGGAHPRRRPRPPRPGGRACGLRRAAAPPATMWRWPSPALTESAWQIRQGAARALAGATPEDAVPALADALGDAHLDVRKAAVLTLTTWTEDPAAQQRAAHRDRRLGRRRARLRPARARRRRSRPRP